MSIFKTLPLLTIGTTKERPEISKDFLSKRDALRLTAAMDCYALAMAHRSEKGITRLTLRAMGGMTTTDKKHIPPFGNLGYWPGFDNFVVATESKRLTTLLRLLEPHLGDKALFTEPFVEIDREQMQRETGTRALISRDYTLPISGSQHKTMEAIAWLSQFTLD